LSLLPHSSRSAPAAPPSTAHDRRRGADRRRTHRERRQLLLKHAPDDDRRRASDERRSGLDRRTAPLRGVRRSSRPALGRATSIQPLGTLIDVYA